MRSKDYLKVCHFPKLLIGSSLTTSSAYQTEIDNLTKRSKSSDNAFLHVYKVLAEAPDPYPLLEAAVVRVMDTTFDIS